MPLHRDRRATQQTRPPRPGGDGSAFDTSFRRRLLSVAAVFGLALAALLARAAQLCVVSAEAFGAQAMKQVLHDLQLHGPRGDILDRSGAPLAVSVQVSSLAARPKAIEDRARVAEALARTLQLRFEEVFPALTGTRGFVWIRRWLAPDQAARIEALGEHGLSLVPESRRYYPGRELAAHLLGFVGHDERGLEGLERAFDRELSGEPLTLTSLRDARGRHLLLGGVTPPATAGAGRSLVLTLDRGVQYLTEQALRRVVETSGAAAATAVVLEPQSGDIAALASYPAFNPNAIGKDDAGRRRNRAVADSFEPGSIMKVLTLAAAIEDRAISLTEKIFCENGSWRFGKHHITDLHRAGHLTPAEIIKFSSNICTAKIGLRLGAERLHAGLRRFLLGERTGAPLPGEVPGVLHPVARWRKSHVVTHSYGYGATVTALQLAQAYAAIAQGGELTRPRLVRSVIDRDGKVLQQFGREVRGRAVSAETARIVTRMMVGVTEKGGTGRRAAIPGFEVAGKTGTAMKVGPDGVYTSEKRRVFFAGFVPAEAPRLVAVVMVDEPRGKVTGGQVAAPAWREIAEGVLRLWNVAPTREIEKPTARTAARSGPRPEGGG
jgi:cell division protein FtsI (penicillin-binding protein 3)